MTEQKKLSETEEKVIDAVLNLANALEAAAVDVKQRIGELIGTEAKQPAAVSETTFSILSFEAQKGEKLGDYETASSKNNISDKWNQAFNILRQSNATINHRYHGETYQFSYWIYGDRIFRQKLKPKT